MTSASKKRRQRRRKREKRNEELQRARAVSLIDVASPTPTIDQHTTEDRRNGSNGKVSDHIIRNQLDTNDDIATDIPVNLPKESTWKRVDFVLPRAEGKKRFIFHPKTKDEISSSKTSAESAHKKALEGRKSETIEEILFPSKRQRKDVPKNDLVVSQDNDEGSNNETKLKSRDDYVRSEPQHRKLELEFESLHRTENGLIGNAVDLLKTNEQNGGRSICSSIGSELFVRSPQLGNESRNKSIDDNHIKDSDEKHQKLQKLSSLSTAQSSPGKISGRTVKEAVRDKKGLRPRANSTDGELNLPRGGLCDERMILEAHKWNKDRKFTNQTPPRGFHNLGNTCFLNATLQCLTYLPPLCQTLIAISDSKIRNGGKRKMPQGQQITSSLCNIFHQAHGLNNGSSKIGGAFAPKKLVSHLPNIGSCGSRNGHQFCLGRQEDAHEFLVHLLDAMNDGELRAAGINQTVSGWRDRLPVSRLDETTFVHRIFGGYFRSQVRCRRCNFKSNTYDPFLDLSLEVSKKTSTSVLKALSEFTRKETLDAANQWKCSGCKKFAFDNSFGFGQKFSKYHNGYGSSSGGSKITKPVEFPATLHLPLSDNRSCQYTLTGIVIHVGGSSQSGHYTAYVKRPGKNGSSQWYHIDDSFVQPVSEKTVLKQRDAYLLFYCRTEVKLEFPDPPTRSMSASEATEFGRTRAIARAKSLPTESSKRESIGRLQIPAVKNNNNPQSQQGTTSPRGTMEQNVIVQKDKATTDATPQIVGVGEINNFDRAKQREKDGSTSSSSSSRSDNSDKRAKSDLNASSEELSSNESSTDNNISSDSDLSSHEKDSESDDIRTRNPLILHKSTSSRDNGVSSSVVETDEGKDSTNVSLQNPNQSESSSETSRADDSSDQGTENKNRTKNESLANSKRNITSSSPKTDQVVQNSTDSRGKVKVVLGPRVRKAWKSSASPLSSKDSKFQLLGNMKVSQWDDDDDDSDERNTNGNESTTIGNRLIGSRTQSKRKNIIDNIEKQNRSRKRKMHLDRWDSHLDQGKLKKVKATSKVNPHETASTAPNKNIFQRIQSGVQRMSRGKPKGHFRRKFGKRKASF